MDKVLLIKLMNPRFISNRTENIYLSTEIKSPPPASSNIFNMDLGPKVVRIMSATACNEIDRECQYGSNSILAF